MVPSSRTHQCKRGCSVQNVAPTKTLLQSQHNHNLEKGSAFLQHSQKGDKCCDQLHTNCVAFCSPTTHIDHCSMTIHPHSFFSLLPSRPTYGLQISFDSERLPIVTSGSTFPPPYPVRGPTSTLGRCGGREFLRRCVSRPPPLNLTLLGDAAGGVPLAGRPFAATTKAQKMRRVRRPVVRWARMLVVLDMLGWLEGKIGGRAWGLRVTCCGCCSGVFYTSLRSQRSSDLDGHLGDHCCGDEIYRSRSRLSACADRTLQSAEEFSMRSDLVAKAVCVVALLCTLLFPTGI